MKIVHLCLASFYVDNGSYQENLLPRYHKKNGYDVEIIASLDTFNEYGQLVIGDGPNEYRNEDGILVRRLKYRINKIDKKLKRFYGVFASLSKSRPDVIFIHGCQFLDIYKVIKYIKLYPSVRVFVDNHADFSNSARNLFSKVILHRILWRKCAQSILPYVTKFYGVLPSRVDFLNEVYGIPRDSVELLLMGADDDLLIEAVSGASSLRKRLDISEGDFIIVTGGKIDFAKQEVLNLMRAIKQLNYQHVKLLVFGSVIPEIKKEFDSLLSENVIYLGWINSKESYSYFQMANLIVFPGRHSVFWEQVVAQQKPMLVKYWPGTTHVDIGENVLFLKQADTKEIEEQISNIVDNPQILAGITRGAQSDKSKNFLYSKIALKSLGLTREV